MADTVRIGTGDNCDVKINLSQASTSANDGTVIEMRSGDIFYIPAGHDSWVVGDEPYVSLHIVGSEDYAN